MSEKAVLSKRFENGSRTVEFKEKNLIDNNIRSLVAMFVIVGIQLKIRIQCWRQNVMANASVILSNIVVMKLENL